MARDRRAERVAVALTIVVLVAIAVDIVLLLTTGMAPTDQVAFAADMVLACGLALAGAAIVRRQPGNRLAWLFLVIALGFADYLLLSDLAEWLWQQGETGLYPWVKLIGYAGGEIAWPMLWLIGQVYPDGKPVSRRWRPLWWVSLAWLAAGFVTTLTTPPLAGEGWRTGNPLALGASFDPPDWLRVGSVLVVFGGSLLALAVRFVRSTGAERQQMKVFLLALVALPIGLFAGLGPATGPDRFADGYWLWPALGAAALPIGLGLAVLRYRLWEVDRLVSRTLGYAITSAALLGLYVAAVTLLTRLLPLPDTVAIAFGILSAATVFHPLRRRVQRAVDRRFDRGRIDAEATLAAFRARLLDSLSEDAVRRELVDTVSVHLQPDRAVLLSPALSRPAPDGNGFAPASSNEVQASRVG